MRQPEITLDCTVDSANLKAENINHDVWITLRNDGSVEIEQDGHGGWQCCSRHGSYFDLTIEQMEELGDWLKTAAALKRIKETP